MNDINSYTQNNTNQCCVYKSGIVRFERKKQTALATNKTGHLTSSCQHVPPLVNAYTDELISLFNINQPIQLKTLAITRVVQWQNIQKIRHHCECILCLQTRYFRSSLWKKWL